MAATKPEAKQEEFWVKNISGGHRVFQYREAKEIDGKEEFEVKMQSLPRGVKVLLSQDLHEKMAKSEPFKHQVKGHKKDGKVLRKPDFEVSHPEAFK